MFNGILKSDDVEVIEAREQVTYIAIPDNCKSNYFINSVGYQVYLNLPNTAFIGKVISFTASYGMIPTGKVGSSSLVYIQHSNTTIFTLRQGTVSFMYVGQQLNGLTATDKAKSGWIILGGVQGDTAITGYAGSVAIGSGAYCGGLQSVAIGNNSVGTGQASTSLGYATNASGNQATSVGSGAVSSASYGLAIGYSANCVSTRIAMKGNSTFGTAGDAQAGKFILMRQTADATPLVMSATNAAASTINILILPNNGTYAFKGIVVAKDATTLDSAMWEVTALMKRGANASTTALVGTPTITKVFNDVGAAAWTIALTADTTNGGGAITVTGEAGKTIRWVSNIDSAEVI